MTRDVADHASPVQSVHAPVPKRGDTLERTPGSVDLRAPDTMSPSTDANAHMREEAQPVRPCDLRQQKSDEKTVRFAEANVDEKTGEWPVRPGMGQTFT